MSAVWLAMMAAPCGAATTVSCTAAATGVAFGIYDPVGSNGECVNRQREGHLLRPRQWLGECDAQRDLEPWLEQQLRDAQNVFRRERAQLQFVLEHCV